MALKLGELLVREKLISPVQLQQALVEQQKKGRRLGTNLVRLGFIEEQKLAQFFSKMLGVPCINLAEVEFDLEAIKLVPAELAHRHTLIPIVRAGPTLVLAMADPSNIFAVGDIEFLVGLQVDVVVAPESAIAEAINRYYPEEASPASIPPPMPTSGKIEENEMTKKPTQPTVSVNLISKEKVKKPLAERKVSGPPEKNERPGPNLPEPMELADFLRRQSGVPKVNPLQWELNPQVINLVSEEFARRHNLLPIMCSGTTLTVAMADPSDLEAINNLAFITGRRVEPAAAAAEEIQKAIEKYYGAGGLGKEEAMAEFPDLDIAIEEEEGPELLDLSDLEVRLEEPPVVRLVNMILTDAIKKKATEIHLEYYQRSYRIRYRIDARLYEVMLPPMKLCQPIADWIKHMAGLLQEPFPAWIEEWEQAKKRAQSPPRGRIKRLLAGFAAPKKAQPPVAPPASSLQEGRLQVRMGKDQPVHFLLSIVPSQFGETMVLRVIDKSELTLPADQMGFRPEQLILVRKALDQPRGLILVAGPARSGKTATSYSLLGELNTPEKNIMTAEPLAKYWLDGLNQVKMKRDEGGCSSQDLRILMSQAPDALFWGELADFQTAEFLVEAADARCLVLAQMHAPDAVAALFRLLQLGIDPFLLSEALQLVISPRLLPKICPECKTPIAIIEPHRFIDLGCDPKIAEQTIPQRGAGCWKCNETGFTGAVRVFEVFAMSKEIKRLIRNQAEIEQVKAKALEQGMITLRQMGWHCVRQGLTTLEEAIRFTPPGGPRDSG